MFDVLGLVRILWVLCFALPVVFVVVGFGGLCLARFA